MDRGWGTSGRWPGAVFAGLLLLSIGPGRVALAEETCASSGCHAELLAGATVHPVAESCDSCHEPVATPHPQKGVKTFKLAQEPPELCFACHDAIAAKAHPHAPVDAGMCTSCHSPHSSAHPHLLPETEKNTCLGCHDSILTKSMTVLHGPVAEGKCTPCHDPHGSDNPKLLKAEFPQGAYSPYTGKEYALCFTCHSRELVQAAKTSTATGFRDGDRNLHALHVNGGEKGRNCRLCHALHGGSAPKLVADGAPFGKWTLPLKFVKTDTGGSCAPGCHRMQAYDRKSPQG